MSLNEQFGIIGDSAVMRRLRELIVRIAPSNLPVLIQGPTGVGKELVAQAIHVASGRRGPWVAFNVCALPEGTVESALFGHARGGFTGAISDAPGYLAEADGRTAFFDEIGGLPPVLQRKLLRAIECRQFRPVGGRADRSSDFRVVTATNEDLAALAERGAFRADLLFRLRGAVVRVPALAEHREDIPELARLFLGAQVGLGAGVHLTPEGLRLLQAYYWPGNVRQLRLALWQAAMLATGNRIGRAELAAALADDTGTPAAGDQRDGERRRLLALMEQVGWDTAEAAVRCGTHRATVYRRMQRFGITPPRKVGIGFARIRANSHRPGANPRECVAGDPR